MNKKNIKPLIMSSLAALSMCSISVAGTFALFTDKAETTINIGSGKVDISQELSITSVSELGGVNVAASDGIYTNSIGGTTKINANGELVLDKWAPGDKAVILITNKNSSNVTIKTRFVVSHTSTSNKDLWNALTVTYDAVDENENDINHKFMDWSIVEPTVTTISKVRVTIEFKDHDNGNIRFGEDNLDNDFQNCNCSILFTQEAVQGNAQTNSLIDQLNAVLDASPAKNDTLHDALVELQAANDQDWGENLIKNNIFLWNSESDHFVYRDEAAAGQEYKYFRICKSMPIAQTYSIYASNDWNGGASVSLSGIGFDAGDAEGITSVSYAGLGQESARSNIIRTNSSSTNLTVNAPYDTIYHYGNAGSVDIIAAASNSYHENGKVAFMEVAKGRVVLENDSDVDQIHISTKVTDVDENGDKTKQANVFDEIKIAYAEEVETLPVFSRDAVEIAAGGTLVVELQKVEAEEVKSNEYVWLYQQGLKEQIRVTEEKEVTAEQLAAAPKSTDSAKVEEKTATAAEQIANNLLGDKTYEQLVQEEKIAEDGSIKSTETETLALVEESGLTADDLKDVKDEKVTEAVQQECKHEHVSRDHNDYWKRVNDKFEFYSDYKCDDCGKILEVKHDLAGMWSNTEHHLVPFVVDNLNAVDLLGSEEIVGQYAQEIGINGLEFISLVDSERISLDDLSYFAIFDSGRAPGMANNKDYFTVDTEKQTATPTQYTEGAITSEQMQEYFQNDYADFYLEFNFNVPASLMQLCGYYKQAGAFALGASNFGSENTEIPANQKIYLAHDGMNIGGIQYNSLLYMQFLCGIYIDPAEAYSMYMKSETSRKALEQFYNEGQVILGLSMFDGDNSDVKLFDTFEMTVSMKDIIPEELANELFSQNND